MIKLKIKKKTKERKKIIVTVNNDMCYMWGVEQWIPSSISVW
jgi:hypothetical protein